MSITKDEYKALKKLFITREECNDNTQGLIEKRSQSERDIAVIKSKLNLIVGIVSALGTGVITCLIQIILQKL